MEFFVRMFVDSGATTADFARVANLTSSQVKITLSQRATDSQSAWDQELKTYFAVKQDFEEARYEDVRNRQMKEMEFEDSLQSKLSVR